MASSSQAYQILPPHTPIGHADFGDKSVPVILDRAWWRFFNTTQGKVSAPASGGLSAIFPPQTANFTADVGDLYHIDPTLTAITAKLPVAPAAGDTIEFIDTTGQAAVHNITINGNGKNIMGSATAVIATPYGLMKIQYNGTQWVQVF